MVETDDYIKALHADKESFANYYLKSFSEKTEQQKLLESLLEKNAGKPEHIADIACGGGSLSFHLHKIYPQAHFSLADLNEEAIVLAKKKLTERSFSFFHESIYDLVSFGGNYFDLVFCWQTLSWLNDPRTALCELIRIAKPGGKIYASALFNLEHDTDLYTKIIDHSRPSSAKELHFNYNTYSRHSVETWIGAHVTSFEIIPFDPGIDLICDGRGIGTFTRKMEDGRRLQFSAGMLLNWGILVITK